jgi:hypothetical protein
MSLCKYGCGKEIYWNQDGPPWIPHEDEALTKVHDCPNNPNKQQPKQTAPATPKVSPRKEPEPETIGRAVKEPGSSPKPTPRALPIEPAQKPLANVPPLSDDELNFYHKLYHLFKEPVK